MESLRWAFMVTPAELNSLMDEIESTNYFGDNKIPADQAQGIRECRGLLHLNNVALVPELIDIEGATLNG